METFCVESILRGYHIYKDIPWEPAIGTTLLCERGAFNLDNPYAVAAMNRGVVVGRVSTISALYSIFLQKGEVICCEITGTGSTPHIYLRVGLNCLNLVVIQMRSRKYRNC